MVEEGHCDRDSIQIARVFFLDRALEGGLVGR
jgi:hypothetical protein